MMFITLLPHGIHAWHSLLLWARPIKWPMTFLNQVVFYKNGKGTAQETKSLISVMHVEFDSEFNKVKTVCKLAGYFLIYS